MLVFGIALALVSGLLAMCGKQLIRYAELQRRKAPAPNSPQVRRALTLRVVGVLMTGVIGPAIDTASYAFAPQSLIAPISGLQVVWNIIFAPCTLRERITCHRAIAAVLIAAGTSLTVVFGSHAEVEYTRDLVESLLLSTRVLIYLVCLAVFVAANMCFYMRQQPGDMRRGLSLGITAGTIAGNLFCVKATAEMAKGIFTGKAHVWLHWVPWVTLVGMVFFALSNLKLMEQGMREHEVTFMVTLYQGAQILSGCLSGAVVLRELDGFEGSRLGAYCGSVAGIVVGIGVLWAGDVLFSPATVSAPAAVSPAELEKEPKDAKQLEEGLEGSLDQKELETSVVRPSGCEDELLDPPLWSVACACTTQEVVLVRVNTPDSLTLSPAESL